MQVRRLRRRLLWPRNQDSNDSDFVLVGLEYTNVNELNRENVASARYFKVSDNDVVMFGESLREYVI